MYLVLIQFSLPKEKIHLCPALIKTIFRLLLPKIKSFEHQVQSALPLLLPLLANPALSLENWTVTTRTPAG